MPHWRLAAGLSASILYLAASHWLMLNSADKPWTVAALIGPLWLVGLIAALRQRHVPALAALACAAVVVAAVVARGGVGDVNRLYVLQHAGTHLALFASFASSLRPGRIALISRVAERVHHSFTPDMRAYTRRVTVAWTLYFLAMTLLSVTTYLFAHWETWSLLANVATPMAIGALFVGEHVLRYQLHPEFERATLMDAVRAWRSVEARSAR